MLSFFYGLCLDNSRSISGQKMPSQFEIAWLLKSHWYTWNISFPPFRFLKTGGKSVGVFLMSFHRLNGSRKKRNFFLFIEALKNLPKFKVQLIFITDFSFNCWRTIWDIYVFNFQIVKLYLYNHKRSMIVLQRRDGILEICVFRLWSHDIIYNWVGYVQSFRSNHDKLPVFYWTNAKITISMRTISVF